MYGYIYKTTNLIDNKIYIGQHKANNNQFDTSYFGSGKILLEAIDRYGIENFKCELIEWCETFEDLNAREIYWIAKLHATERGIGYNICTGGQGIPGLFGELNPNYGKKFSDETRRKLSESHIGIQSGENHPMYGKHHSEETKKLISDKKSGINHPNYGKHLSEETKNKISDKAKLRTGEKNNRFGTHHSEETKKKMSLSSGKKIINLDTGEIFNSLKEAAEKYNTYSSSICYCCNGKYKSAAGQHWSYYLD